MNVFEYYYSKVQLFKDQVITVNFFMRRCNEPIVVQCPYPGRTLVTNEHLQHWLHLQYNIKKKEDAVTTTTEKNNLSKPFYISIELIWFKNWSSSLAITRAIRQFYCKNGRLIRKTCNFLFNEWCWSTRFKSRDYFQLCSLQIRPKNFKSRETLLMYFFGSRPFIE